MRAEDLGETIQSLQLPATVMEITPDRRFRLVDINDACRQLFNTDDDPRGRYTEEFVFSPTAAERTTALAAACLEKREPISSEEAFVLRDGSILHVRMTIAPFVDRGEVTHLLSTVDDVSEIVNLRMERARELALAASGFVEMCAWCNGVVTEQGLQPPDKFVEGLHLASTGDVLCPDCETRQGQA